MTELKNTEQASPFSRAPQGGMLFEANTHVEALARLQLVIEHQEFGVLTGEVGSGKSTLVRHQWMVCEILRGQTSKIQSVIMDECVVIGYNGNDSNNKQVGDFDGSS